MISATAQIVMETNAESISIGLRSFLEKDSNIGFLYGTKINIGEFSINGLQMIIGSILGTAIFFTFIGNATLSHKNVGVENMGTMYKSISYVAYMLFSTILLLELISDETIYMGLHLYWLWNLLDGWVGSIIIWVTALTLVSSALMIYQSHFVIFLYDAYKGKKGLPYYSTIASEVIAISLVLLLMVWITLTSLGGQLFTILIMLIVIELVLIVGTLIMSMKTDNFEKTAYISAIFLPRVSMYIKIGAVMVIMFLILTMAIIVITVTILIIWGILSAIF